MTKRIAILAPVWPEPTSSAAGWRIRELAHTFRAQGWHVAVAATAALEPEPAGQAHTRVRAQSPFRQALENEGCETRSIRPNDPEFDTWIEAFNPDCVVFDRFILEEQFGWRVKAKVPGAARILEAIDLHSLRRARTQLAAKSLGKVFGGTQGWEGADLSRELASILRCDQTWLLSSREAELLIELGVPANKLRVHQLAVSLPEKMTAVEEKRGFVTIGNFRHPPNLDAVAWLRHDLWPAIRKKLGPNVELHVYGSYAPREAMAWENPALGFRMMGWAENAQATLDRYAVLLAPLRSGAGVKGKILEAWSVGTAVATTSVGAEGLFSSAFGCVEDDGPTWVESVAALYGDLERRAKLAVESRTTVRQFHDAETLGKELISCVENLTPEALIRLRRADPLGEMLWHQTLRSTEYFSRWIESKKGSTDPISS